MCRMTTHGNSVLYAQLCYEPKTILKNSSLIRKKCVSLQKKKKETHNQKHLTKKEPRGGHTECSILENTFSHLKLPAFGHYKCHLQKPRLVSSHHSVPLLSTKCGLKKYKVNMNFS